MIRTEILGCAMILTIMFITVFKPTLFGRDVGQMQACNAIGCKYINYMQTAWQGNPNGCYQFQNPTGRVVRNNTNDVGGSSTVDAGFQASLFWVNQDCSACIAPPNNQVAVDSMDPGGAGQEHWDRTRIQLRKFTLVRSERSQKDLLEEVLATAR